MEGEFWTGASLAIVASTFLNIGKGLQKWKVAVLGEGRRVLSPENRGNFAVWVMGTSLTASASVIYSLALKYADKPSTVSALNGVGLIGLVIFAWAVLNERVGWREVAGAGLVVLGTAVMGYFDTPTDATEVNLGALAIAVAVGLVLYAPLALYSWNAKRFHGVVFGSLAGTLIGTAMVLGDIALVQSGGAILGQLGGPTVYVALGIGGVALAITQVAFWRSAAMVVVPTTNSFIIFTPLVLQYFAFGTVLGAAQYIGVAVIVAGVVPLTMGSK